MDDRFDEGWERQYAAGRALNRYPFDIVVTLTARYFGGNQRQPAPKVLDLGCGAGNHAMFFARLGFAVTCVDVSASALHVARQRLEAEGLSAQFHHMTFAAIGTLDTTFDLVLDRFALSFADFSHLRGTIMPSIRGRMAPDSVLFSFIPSQALRVKRLSEAPIASYTLDDLEHATGGDPMRMTRLDRQGIDALYEGFHIVQLHYHHCEELLVAPGEPALGEAAEYIVVCRPRTA